MPTELEVEGILRKHLKDHGFAVKERTSKHGVDITAFKDGKAFYVEVECNTKPDGKPLTASQKSLRDKAWKGQGKGSKHLKKLNIHVDPRNPSQNLIVGSIHFCDL